MTMNVQCGISPQFFIRSGQHAKPFAPIWFKPSNSTSRVWSRRSSRHPNLGWIGVRPSLFIGKRQFKTSAKCAFANSSTQNGKRTRHLLLDLRWVTSSIRLWWRIASGVRFCTTSISPISFGLEWNHIRRLDFRNGRRAHAWRGMIFIWQFPCPNSISNFCLIISNSSYNVSAWTLDNF